MINILEKIKPLSLFTRNRMESHDRGITYHLYCSTSEMLMSIFFDTKKKHASRVTLVTSVTHKLTEVKA